MAQLSAYSTAKTPTAYQKVSWMIFRVRVPSHQPRSIGFRVMRLSFCTTGPALRASGTLCGLASPTGRESPSEIALPHLETQPLRNPHPEHRSILRCDACVVARTDHSPRHEDRRHYTREPPRPRSRP